MELVNSLYTFFGISALAETATFIDLLQLIIKVMLAIWLTAFIIRSMFLVMTVPRRGF